MEMIQCDVALAIIVAVAGERGNVERKAWS